MQGLHWNYASIGNGSCSDVVTSNDGSRVYAVGGFSAIDYPGTQGIGYWMSTNYGYNFIQMTGSGFNPYARTQISVSKNNDSYVYAVTNTGGNVVAYMSSDGGITFPTSKIVDESSGDFQRMLILYYLPKNY